MTTARNTRRIGAIARSAVSLLAVGCVLLVLGACTKGRTTNTPTGASTTTAPSGIPTYVVSVSAFTFHGMPDTVPADAPFRVVFANKEAFEITHEMVLIGIPAGKTVDDVIADTKAKGASAEDDWLHFGEIPDVNTGATGVAAFDLPAGNYAIACWQEGKPGGGTGPLHATIGMIKGFSAVAGGSATASGAPVPPAASGNGQTYNVSVKAFTFHGMPDTVPANTLFNVVFTNQEAFEITHEMVLIGIPAGKTVDDVIADTKAKGASAEDDWLHFGEIPDVNTGASGVAFFDLPPGNYAIACWQEGKPGGGTGPLHATIGMIKGFTVA